jgi:hypothetical protein
MPRLKEIYERNLLKTLTQGGSVYTNVLTAAYSTNTYKTPRTSINPNQPFIYIGPGTDNTTSGVFKGDRGAFLSTANAKDDIRLLPFGVSFARDNNRITKFLLSPAGTRFASNQTVLQFFNPYSKTKIFNPAAILASIVPGVHAKRFIDTNIIRNPLSSLGLSSNIPLFSPNELGPYGLNGYFKTNTTTGKKNKIFEAIKEEFSTLTNPGRVRKRSNISDAFNPSDVVPKGSTSPSSFFVNYDFLRKNPALITNQQFDFNAPENRDIIAFRFKSFGGPTNQQAEYIPFRAFISRLNENVKPDYNEQRYIGRTERFVTYSGVKRGISLDFNIVAFSKSEIDSVWTKINYLTGLAFPKGVTSTGFLQPQLFRITIGGIYEDQPCFIESLDYEFLDESNTFDIDKGVAQHVAVKMQLSLIEKTSKYYNSPFYKIVEDVANKQKNPTPVRGEQVSAAFNSDSDPRTVNNILSART